MPSIGDAVAQLQAADLPVLFVDTCSLLDVIRAPMRRGELGGCVEAALALLELATVPPYQCSLVVASFVPGEWLAHAGPEADSLRAHLIRLDEEAAAMHQFCTLVELTPPFAPSQYVHLPLAVRLFEISRLLLDHALRLDSDHGSIIRAHGRASSYVPPSLKGGEVKDSTIIEECLEVSRRLQSVGFSRKRVFCTSNRRDYCESGSRLHSSLATDFRAVGLGFVTILPWAVSEIRNP